MFIGVIPGVGYAPVFIILLLFSDVNSIYINRRRKKKMSAEAVMVVMLVS